MSIPTCPICNHQSANPLFVLKDYPLQRCSACGTQFLFPQPTDEVLARIYNADYFLSDGTPEGIERMRCMKQATAARYMAKILAHNNGQRGKLLEIGCGTGSFLLEAAAQGFAVSGIEISPHATEIANERLGFPAVAAGTLETVIQPDEHYDAIALSDVFEHLRDPMGFLNEAYRVLKPGGRLFIVTCSLDSLSARISGRHWLEYKVEHLVYCTNHSMHLALQRAGFAHIDIQPDQKTLTIDYIDHHFQRFTVPLLTPLLHLGRKLIGDRLAYRPLRMTTSGLMALAVKPA